MESVYAEKIRELIENAKRDGVDIQPYEKEIKISDMKIVVERGIAISTGDNEIDYIPTWRR